MHFGISEGKGGLKHGSRPWLGMDIFWNCPFRSFCMTQHLHDGQKNCHVG